MVGSPFVISFILNSAADGPPTDMRPKQTAQAPPAAPKSGNSVCASRRDPSDTAAHRYVQKYPPVRPAQQSKSVSLLSLLSDTLAYLFLYYRNSPAYARKKRGVHGKVPRHTPGFMETAACASFYAPAKNGEHIPVPRGHSPMRTGQQLCPNRSRRLKKAKTGFFSTLRPRIPSCIISIIPPGHVLQRPRGQQERPPSVGAGGRSVSIFPHL